MIDASGCGGDDIERPHHARRKLVEDGRFQARDSGETRMISCARCEVDARAPSLVERIGRRIDHAWERFDTLQLAHRRHGQDRLDGGAKALVVDGPGEAAGEADGRLLKGHDLQAMTALAGRRQAAFPHREAAVNDEG